ncbi:MAG: hypothetical protein RH917_03680 [Lacipirellulaceae bacterium]
MNETGHQSDSRSPTLRTVRIENNTPVERLATAHGMWTYARDLIRRVLRREHPDWEQEQIDQEVARRLSGGSS